MLFPVIEPFLDTVIKPARYVGGELNSIKKDPDAQTIRTCLAFPDVYDIGQSYMGFYILYHILNKRPGTLCERTFAPWPDMEKVMRREGIPLWSLESFLPVKSFDVLGFTLQYELHYTTILNMLDLAGIPLDADKRTDVDPIVLGGGTNCANPEPMAPYFDAFLLGDGEEAFPEMIDMIERSKQDGVPRTETIHALAGIGGVYVPSLYREKRTADGLYDGLEPVTEEAPYPIHARYVEELKPSNYPDKPLVPLCDIVHDRLAVEIMRGCTRGCRFCGAGMTYRPRRQRPIADIVNQVATGIASTGWEDVSLVSLSNTDYEGLDVLVRRLGSALRNKRVSISLSSLRADNFSLGIAEAVAGGKKSSLTFAVEAATQRLRDVINKNLTEEQLFETVTSALEGGWRGFKLYFMIGLPTETDEDVIAIAELLNRLNRLLKQHQGRHINVTVSVFCPKPMTPFQWEAQISGPEIERRLKLIRENLRARGVHLKESSPQVSLLESVLGRGGRELAPAIRLAWKNGCRLDGWSEHLRADLWREALETVGIALDDGTPVLDPDTPLPWDHLDSGVDTGYLRRERERGYTGACTPDCSTGECQACGPYAPFCAAQKKQNHPSPTAAQTAAPARDTSAWGRKRRTVAPKQIPTGPYGSRVRLKFSKNGVARFTGHLDMVRLFDRIFRRSGIPVAYSQGFHPHPKISFGPTLPLGMRSIAEYVDFSLGEAAADLEQTIQRGFPEGFSLLGLRSIPDKAASLNSIIKYAAYRVDSLVDDDTAARIDELLGLDSKEITRWTKKGMKTVDIRPGIIELTVSGDRQSLSMLLSQDPATFVKPAEVLTYVFGGERYHDITRLEQYVTIDGDRQTPLDVIR